jgi:PAS domain S-box-containing protein
MRFEKYFIIVSFFILILFLAVQYTIYNNVKEQTIQNINLSQLNQASQAATGIEDYINNFINTLNFLSHFPEIINLNDHGREIMARYQQLSSREIKGVTRTDSHGKIIYTTPDTKSIGKDISKQKHFITSMITHKTVVSDVFMAVQGFKTIAVHVPVFKNGVYDGTVSFLLSFDNIIQKYIQNIRVGKSGYAWVVDENGIEISSPIPGHTGKNVYDTYKNFPEITAMVDEMLKGKQGVTTYHYIRTGSQSVENVIEHAVYRPIPIGNTFWSIVIATPEDELISSFALLKTRLLLITIILLTIYVICIYYIVRFKIISTEQTKRQEVLMALKESESRYKTLFEQNPAPTLIYELGTLNILAVNDVFLLSYGYSPDEILKMCLTDLYPEDQKDAIANVIKGLHGYMNVGEWRHRKKDGSFMNIIACSNDLIYEGRKARIAVITDITERKQTDEILKESERRLSLIFDTVSEVLFLMSVEPEDCFRFISVNSTFLAVTGLNRGQIIGKRMEEVLPKSSRELVRDNYRKAIRENKTIRWEEVSEYPTGKLYGIVSVTPAWNTAGACTHLIGSVNDITEIKYAQEEIRKLNMELEQRVEERTAELAIAKERAEAADRLKSAFLATMSHELRTPLNSIIGFTGILMKGIAGPLNQEQLKQLGMAKGSAQHLLELINDVLDISKIEAGELLVSLRKFDFNTLLKNVTSVIQPFVEKKNLKFQMTISEKVGEINSDERRVGQVFLNLLNNAVKFTDKGIIKIESEIINNSIITKVIDTGIGIKNEDIIKLFRPFSQVDTGLARNREGTGLGLSICKKLLEKLGGSITVESEVGVGSTFTVMLPVGE